jgi:hypothetical protein
LNHIVDLNGGKNVNIDRLKESEKKFFTEFPGGFSDPKMAVIAKRHRSDKMQRMAQESFAADCFEDPPKVVDAMARIVGASSMISRFEIPQFKELFRMLSGSEKEHLALGLKEFLHGAQPLGFAMMCDIFSAYGLCRWPLVTLCPEYYNPAVEVFIRPATVKGIIAYFELSGLQYTPKPNYAFYEEYKRQINSMKILVDESLRDNNAGFCGFLRFCVRAAEAEITQ